MRNAPKKSNPTYKTTNGSVVSLSDDEFIDIWNKFKSGAKMARFLKQTGRYASPSARALMHRRSRIEKRYNIILGSDDHRSPRYTGNSLYKPTSSARANVKIEDGTVLIGSDAHYWPDVITTAHRGFVYLAKKIKPTVIVMNGDVFDGSTIGRWPRGASVDIGWQARPTVKQELETVSDRLHEIFQASLNSKRFWTLGNHDARFELKLAAEVPEFEDVPGFTLKERFPAWTPCWSVFINEDEVCIKHRYRNGIHAAHNNTVNSGISMVTGHLHSLTVRHWSDYKGTRYGVDCGTMMDPYGVQAEGYMEDNPRNWRSGFVLLTFKDGKLMPPELVEVVDEGRIWFRGEIVEV